MAGYSPVKLNFLKQILLLRSISWHVPNKTHKQQNETTEACEATETTKKKTQKPTKRTERDVRNKRSYQNNERHQNDGKKRLNLSLVSVGSFQWFQVVV